MLHQCVRHLLTELGYNTDWNLYTRQRKCEEKKTIDLRKKMRKTKQLSRQIEREKREREREGKSIKIKRRVPNSGYWHDVKRNKQTWREEENHQQIKFQLLFASHSKLCLEH